MMRILRRLVARIRYRRFDEDLERELAVHRAMLEDEARSRGVPESEARYEAARRLGNTTLARETARGVWLAPWLEGLWQDVRHAARGLRASPAFTLPALAVLILTMGPAVGLYATVESVYFRPWPVPDVGRVVAVNTVVQIGNGVVYQTTVAEYRYLRDRLRSLDLVAIGGGSWRFGSPDDERPAFARFVSGNYFDVLRLELIAGRGLHPADDSPGRASVVVIGHELWQRQFGGAPDAVGSLLLIGDTPFTIVGVAAPSASDVRLGGASAWIPLSARLTLSPDDADVQRFFDDPQRGWDAIDVGLAGRLAPGADHRSAETEVDTLARQYAAAHDRRPTEMSVTSTAYWHDPWVQARDHATFWRLSLAGVLTLLLGCANVGNLQLARGLSRRDDLAVRLVLGAPRRRLARQLLVEGLLLSAGAAAISAIGTWYVLPALVQRLRPFAVPRLTIDGQMLLFALALTIAVCLISSVAPALRATRTAGSGRLVTTGSSRVRAALLGAQVAISLIVLMGAALLVRGVQHAGGARLGFNPHAAVAIWTGPPGTYDLPARRRLAEDVAGAARELGLAPVAVARTVPFAGGNTPTFSVRRLEADAPRIGMTYPKTVSPDYFTILEIPVVAGRLFDAASSPGEVVVDETLARLLWPDQAALGRVFLDGDEELRVIGVAADARTEHFNVQYPTYYRGAGRLNYVLVPNEPAAVARLLEIVRSIEPAATPDVVALTAGLGEQLDPSSVGARVAVVIGLLALLLASAGTLGVFSYIVNERTREIGVRMALGARARDIVRTIVAKVSWPLAGGLAAGLLGAQALGSILDSQLYGISPRDPIAYAVVLSVLILAAGFAAWIPARRALRLDTAVTLRAE